MRYRKGCTRERGGRIREIERGTPEREIERDAWFSITKLVMFDLQP